MHELCRSEPPLDYYSHSARVIDTPSFESDGSNRRGVGWCTYDTAGRGLCKVASFGVTRQRFLVREINVMCDIIGEFQCR